MPLSALSSSCEHESVVVEGTCTYAHEQRAVCTFPNFWRSLNAEISDLNHRLVHNLFSILFTSTTAKQTSPGFFIRMEPSPDPYPLVVDREPVPIVPNEPIPEPKKPAQHQPGKKRKLGHSRSATPGTINGDDVGAGDTSRRSSETPASHRYAVTGPDEDARLKTIAKMGTKVPGSGDGGERGEECFFWTDLPMNRLGEI